MSQLCATAEPHGPFGAATGPAGWPVGPTAMFAAVASHAEPTTLQTIARSVAAFQQRDPGSPPGNQNVHGWPRVADVNRARGR